MEDKYNPNEYKYKIKISKTGNCNGCLFNENELSIEQQECPHDKDDILICIGEENQDEYIFVSKSLKLVEILKKL